MERDMHYVKTMLVHLQAAIDIADRENEHLIGAYLSHPMQILLKRLAKEDPSEPSSVPTR